MLDFEKPVVVQRANFVQTINVGGIVAQSWENGCMGWDISMLPHSGILLMRNGNKTFSVSPSMWVTCDLSETQDPLVVPADAVVHPPILVSDGEEADSLSPKSKRIPISAIRERQRKQNVARAKDITK